jgi:hypothetical protein
MASKKGLLPGAIESRVHEPPPSWVLNGGLLNTLQFEVEPQPTADNGYEP